MMDRNTDYSLNADGSLVETITTVAGDLVSAEAYSSELIEERIGQTERDISNANAQLADANLNNEVWHNRKALLLDLLSTKQEDSK